MHKHNPPGVSDFNWKHGKTPHSIAFVRAAEIVCKHSADPISVGLLTDAINKIKRGELVLNEFTLPAQYIKEHS